MSEYHSESLHFINLVVCLVRMYVLVPTSGQKERV